MSKMFYLLISAILLFPFVSSAENNVPKEILERLKNEQVLGNNSQGTKFIVTLPPNDSKGNNYGEPTCEVYISAKTPTNVTVYYGANKSQTKNMSINKAMGVSVAKLDYKLFEIREDDTVSGAKTIIIESKNPVSVYVINSKTTSTDGYMAIPVSAWGKDYVHCSYYDNHESDYSALAGGFIVMAAEDNTTATITARGVGANDDTTAKGRKIGDVWDIKLNAGEYYMVRGAANTDGKFDLTGTSIKADKPIGVISFHEKTGMPWALDYSRDCMNEMVMPVSAWGTRYASVNMVRGKGGKGDIYRVVASEPNTKYTIRWYDTLTFALKKSLSGELKKSGEFFEYIDSPNSVSGTELESINGPAVFEADKPIMVMQYSPEESWDNAEKGSDPLMVIIPAVDQYTMATVFQVPANKDFYDNKINLIVRGDTTDLQRNESLLKSVLIDGVPVYLLYPKLLTNKIPNTDLYFVQGLWMDMGPHYITSDTKFGGFVYGKKSVDSYGWPISMNINNDDKIDTIAPKSKAISIVGVFTIKVTDLDSPNPDPNSKQKQSGVTEYPVLLSTSYNCAVKGAAASFAFWPPNYDTEFYVNVVDKTKEAKAVFVVADLKGNYTIDSVYYYPKGFMISPQQIDCGSVKVHNSIEQEFEIVNNEVNSVIIHSAYLKSGANFKLLTSINEVTIGNKEVIKGKFTYSPVYPSNFVDGIEYDTLFVVTDDLVSRIPIVGRALYSSIYIEDFILDNVAAGMSVCNNLDAYSKSVTISNKGTADLIITGYTVVDISQPFFVDNSVSFPFVIRAGYSMQFQKVCFKPTKSGSAKTDVVFHSDALIGDSISLWQGNCLAGIDDNQMSLGFELKDVSPNPVNDNQFMIRFSTGDNTNTTKIEMLNMNGEIVKLISNELMNAGDHTLNVSTNDLPSGTYLVKITSGACVASQKVVIVK